jgi:predicted RNase H-like HicB family nuclease
MEYRVIYEKFETSWGAYVPDLPGVIANCKKRLAAYRQIVSSQE